MRSLRSGSALIVTLGFLSLLALSAVAFSVWMRAERAPIAQASRASRGRFLLEAAVARACSAIDDDIGDRLSASWPGRVMGTSSAAPNGVNPVLTLEALAYLPGPLAESVRARATFAATARWQRLPFDAGRVAFLAVDVSDLPDLNRIPAATNRTFATNGRLSLAPLFPSAVAAVQHDSRAASLRSGDFPFPFVSQLDYHVSMGFAEAILRGEPTEAPLAVVHSSPAFRASPAVPAVADGETVWRAALAAVLTEEDERTLDDYLDADSVPAALDIPCAERVPQIGAVGWRGLMPVVALAYPFRQVVPDTRRFAVAASVRAETADGTFSADLVSDPVTIIPSNEFGADFATFACELALDGSLLPPMSEGESLEPRQLNLSVTVWVADSAGNRVDETPALSFALTTGGTAAAASVEPTGRAVVDARFNWAADQWRATADPVENWMMPDDAVVCSVSDAGYLQSIGELALLPRPSDATPFDLSAIDLPDDCGVGPRVDSRTAETNLVLTALVNTPCDWTASATNAPLARRQTLETVFGATRTDFERLAARLMAAFRGVDDWQTAYDAFDWMGNAGGTDPLADLSFAARLERVDRVFLRDFWRGCFARRDQLFIVFARVEYGPRAVAVISRETSAGPSGYHAMRLLFFRPLETGL